MDGETIPQRNERAAAAGGGKNRKAQMGWDKLKPFVNFFFSLLFCNWAPEENNEKLGEMCLPPTTYLLQYVCMVLPPKRRH